jgi:hypothetical protein
MKLLAVLVNYGTEQIGYLEQVITELKSFDKYDVTVIVNSNIPLELDEIDGVNLFPNKTSMLPLTCRKTIWQNRNHYDVFLYGENDHLFQQHHVDKFLEYTDILPVYRIAGLIQIERYPDGKLFYPAYHAGFDWDMNSVEVYDNKVFAHFTNLHQATFILTRKQLLRIGAINDFKAFMGKSRYSPKCSVNTDIYQFCGMKKMICISEFDDNLIHHLPNLYIKGDANRKQIGSDDIRMRNKIKLLLDEGRKV